MLSSSPRCACFRLLVLAWADLMPTVRGAQKEAYKKKLAEKEAAIEAEAQAKVAFEQEKQAKREAYAAEMKAKAAAAAEVCEAPTSVPHARPLTPPRWWSAGEEDDGGKQAHRCTEDQGGRPCRGYDGQRSRGAYRGAQGSWFGGADASRFVRLKPSFALSQEESASPASRLAPLNSSERPRRPRTRCESRSCARVPREPRPRAMARCGSLSWRVAWVCVPRRVTACSRACRVRVLGVVLGPCTVVIDL